MANTYVDYTGDGSNQTFNFSFDYLDASHVKVELDGVATTAFTVQTSPKSVLMTTAPASGVVVRVRRNSDSATKLVDFVDGSVLVENDLDKAYLHNLYLNEEIGELNDSSMQKTEGATTWNAGGNRIINVGTPTATTDAATKEYIDDKVALSSTNLTGFNKSTHTGDGSLTAFTLSFTPQTTDAKAFIVSIDGVLQVPDTAYTLSGSTITFTSAPPNSSTICVVATAAASTTSAETAQVTATGSTQARAIKDRFADVVNIKDFGTDYASFFAAVSGKTGYIPANSTDYDINQTTAFSLGAGTELYIEKGATLHCTNSSSEGLLSLEGSNITIHGGGRIKGPQSGGTISYVASQQAIKKTTTTEVSNITIDGITIDGWGNTGIELKNVVNAKVSSCTLYDCGRAGIFFFGCDYSQMEGNYIYNISPGSGGTSPFINAYGVSATTDTDDDPVLTSRGIKINNNIIRNVPTWEGIDIHGVDDFQITNNIVLDCMLGAFIGPSTGTNNANTNRGICSNNLFYTTTTYQRAAVILAPSYSVGSQYGKTFIVSNNVIVGHGRNQNTYDSGFTGTEGAIEVVGCQDVTITGNNIKDAYCAGIHIEQSVLGCTITGNQVTDMNGSGVSGSESKVCFLVSQSNNIIANADGNTFQRLSGTSDAVTVNGTPSTTYGLRYGQENTIIGGFANGLTGKDNLHKDSKWLRRVVAHGFVVNTGTASLQKGYGITSVSRTTTGQVAITLDETLDTSYYTVSITVNSGTAYFASFSNRTTNSFTVYVWDHAGTATDENFTVTVLNP